VSTLTVSERDLRRHGPGHVFGVCWRQWRAERRLARRGVHFRATDVETVAAAYQAMSPAEFHAVNGRQEWANWRTIPRSLSGHVPDRPLRIIDLGCGTGGSTRVLAFYAPPESRITGYEMAEPLLALARRREYSDRHGHTAVVDFVCQQLTGAWRQAGGAVLPPHSVDVVNASGVIGHHFDADTLAPVIAELRRVLRPGGIAMLDVGPSLGSSALRRLMSVAGFSYVGHYRSGWWDPTGQIVFSLCP
jgi:SAM-dependent methyltransferase